MKEEFLERIAMSMGQNEDVLKEIASNSRDLAAISINADTSGVEQQLDILSDVLQELVYEVRESNDISRTMLKPLEMENRRGDMTIFQEIADNLTFIGQRVEDITRKELK